MAILTINVNNRVPTHYCRVCGALWFKGADQWSLVSLHCGQCCDNALMGNQIVALANPLMEGQSVEVGAAVLLRAAQERSCDRRRSLVLRDDALHAISLALSAQVPPEAVSDDNRRLNWLATNPRGAQVMVDGVAKPCIFWGVSASPEHTLREAIDAAMVASAAKPAGEDRADA